MESTWYTGLLGTVLRLHKVQYSKVQYIQLLYQQTFIRGKHVLVAHGAAPAARYLCPGCAQCPPLKQDRCGLQGRLGAGGQLTAGYGG